MKNLLAETSKMRSNIYKNKSKIALSVLAEAPEFGFIIENPAAFCKGQFRSDCAEKILWFVTFL
ncbi:hypothetical protein B5G28_07110 [Faecalibacterium sp. An77]|nr:hypothetical protein B5G28_07110 [Faecalibacterium sp. An77]OUP29422.1 hypothetical protein B5F27_03550 [Faecalibacterium sp. An192]